MKLLSRREKTPRLKFDLLGRTIGYGRLVPAVEYRHCDDRLEVVVHGTMECAMSNAAAIGRGRCRAVWVDPKTGLPAGGDTQ